LEASRELRMQGATTETYGVEETATGPFLVVLRKAR